MNEKAICERAVDLVSYLYGETDERETRDIETHLRECRPCQAEAASFGQVRESIVAWRDEVLTGFIPSAVAVKPRRSAIAAFRQFFDLSPLWLKGATAFAAVAFFALVVLVAVNVNKKTPPPVLANNNTYTQEQVDRLIDEALVRQQTPPVEPPQKPMIHADVLAPKKQVAKGRRPLSRAERDQLAADLRLLPTEDELNLLGDRINQ